MEHRYTIVEAIKVVLSQNPQGMTSMQIYKAIVDQGLYVFGAKDPKNVVNGKVRRHCIDLNFPTAHPRKYFKIVRSEKHKNYFALLDDTNIEEEQAIGESPEQSMEMLPEEQMDLIHRKHIEQIEQMLLEKILEKHPSFFENLVVEMLLKMGYGYDKNSGIVRGGPNDGGIDGIIYEDKLGLDLIYVQAKRYQKNKPVNADQMRVFRDSLRGGMKGVFITTSTFTRGAKKLAEEADIRRICLIDGKELVKYLLQYQIGVEETANFKTYKIDSDYFEDE